MNVIEELKNWKSRLDRQRRQLTAEIDLKIQKVEELIKIAEREAVDSQAGSLFQEGLTLEKPDVRQDMTLWKAMQEVMRFEPEKWWRGADMTQELVSLGYRDEEIAAQVSGTFRRYSQDKDKRPAVLDKKRRGKAPIYRLKQDT